jgi:hypothetical protein
LEPAPNILVYVCKPHYVPATDLNQPRTDRLYVKRKEGGRGLLQVEVAYKTEIINIAEHLNTNYKGDQFVNIVKSMKAHNQI